MDIMAVMLAYIGALDHHLGPKFLQLGVLEASRWSLEGVLFDICLKVFASIAGDPPKTPKITPHGLKILEK